MSTQRPFEFFVQWHLTERCNLACTHCYQEGSAPEEMSYHEIKEAIGDVHDTIAAWSDLYEIDFSPSFNITGGEPFLRRDLFPIIEASVHHGFAVYLLTNGTLIDKDKAQRMVEAGVKGVQVSLEGPEGVHERIRGKGSFSRSMGGVETLTAAGIPVTLNVTLSTVNAAYFQELPEVASRSGAGRLGFSRLVPSGRGTGLLSAMLSREELKTLYEGIFSLPAGGVELVTGDPVATQMTYTPEPDDDSPVPRGGCAAGVSGLTILPDGTMTPCRRLNIPIAMCGAILFARYGPCPRCWRGSVPGARIRGSAGPAGGGRRAGAAGR